MNENLSKSLRKEILARKTLDFLLEHGDETDLDLILYTIDDFEEEGYYMESYRKKVEDFRKKYSK